MGQSRHIHGESTRAGEDLKRCGILPQYYEVYGVPSARMYVNPPQRRLDAGKFHVQTFFIECCGAAGREGASTTMRHVRNAHYGRAADQASEDGALLGMWRLRVGVWIWNSA